MELSNFEAQQFLISAESGRIRISISRIGTEGVICLKEGVLELGLDGDLDVNIYNASKQEFVSEKGYEAGKPLLVL